MNLLIDPWIPVLHAGTFMQITCRDMLCRNDEWQIALPRDDLELAALQLLICLTQVFFTPQSDRELRQRIEQPLSEAEFSIGTAHATDWFELDHPKQPFMQTRGITAKDLTPIQKLFIGLPEGNNHAFFNGVGEVEAVCPGCATIALFNQAVNCPSFGGGFKGSLRGGAPITTLILGTSLRDTVWLNVLTSGRLTASIPWKPAADTPTWVQQLRSGNSIPVHSIGIMRGLLWQPAHVELTWLSGLDRCSICGAHSQQLTKGFWKEKFSYTLEDEEIKWPHPHSPCLHEIKDGRRRDRFPSFTSSAPAWTQLTSFLVRTAPDAKQGHTPAPVVSQYREICPRGRLHLMVGGYRTKQAAVLERRHDLIDLSAGWGEELEGVESLIGDALSARDLLRKKVFGLGKRLGVAGLANDAEAQFYQDSEAMIHGLLRSMDWREATAAREQLLVDLSELSLSIFDQLAAPYAHKPEMLKHVVKSRSGLKGALRKLRSGK